MNKAYKTIAGTYKTVPDDNHLHNCTHIVFEMQEYKAIYDKNVENAKKVEELEAKTQEQAARIQEQHDNISKWADGYKKLEKDKNAIQAERDTLQAELDRYKNMNEKLSQMYRTQASKERGITPKKEGSGFRIVDMTESFIRVGKKQQYRCFITTIETPYKLTVDYEELDPGILLYQDNFDEVFGVWCCDNRDTTFEDKAFSQDKIFDIQYNPMFCELNVVFKRNWKMGKNGYWELVIYHTKRFPNPQFGQLIGMGNPHALINCTAYDDEEDVFVDPRDKFDGVFAMKEFSIINGRKVYNITPIDDEN